MAPLSAAPKMRAAVAGASGIAERPGLTTWGVGAGAQVIGNPAQIERIAGENWEMLDGIMVIAKAAVLPDGWKRK